MLKHKVLTSTIWNLPTSDMHISRSKNKMVLNVFPAYDLNFLGDNVRAIYLYNKTCQITTSAQKTYQ